MRGLSTLTEVLLRGKIYEISESILRPGVKIVIFTDGTQCNIDQETFEKLEISV